MNKRIKKIILKWMGVKENSDLVKNIPSETPHHEQVVWISLLHKCYVPTNALFPFFGDKGYRVCDDWKNHPYRFFEWLHENNWDREMRLDIKERAKIFSPSNCFLTIFRKYVKRGKKNKYFLYEYDGRMKSLRGWGKEYDINPHTLQTRLRFLNGDIKLAIEIPYHCKHRHPLYRSDVSKEELKEMYEGGMPTREIQKKLGFSMIYPRLKEAGVKLRRPHKNKNRSNRNRVK